MGFEFTDRHIEEFHTQGYTVFRDLLPPPLLRDLRVQAERARPAAYQSRGANAQRLQPFQPHVDFHPFEALWEFPPLLKALREIFGNDQEMKLDGDAILYEPGGSPYCMCWHRDYRDLWPGLDVHKWERLIHDPRLFNQTNIALYDDGCLWVVPGSHLRRDTPQEIRRFPDRPLIEPDVSRMNPEEAEYACREYVLSMPGAQQAWLNAGDFMCYRNTLWHIGNYVPYAKRATIHGSIVTPEYADFVIKDFMPFVDPAGGPHKFTNLNAGTPAYREVYVRMLAQRYWRKLNNLPRRVARRLTHVFSPAQR